MSNLLFRNGFLLTDQKRPELPEPIAAIIARWCPYDLRAVRLFTEPRLPVAQAGTEGCTVMLLGTAYDPQHKRHDEAEIAEALRSAAEASEEAFLDALDGIGGRFVVIVRDSRRVRIFPDACATKAVFYDAVSSSILVSSHAALIAEIQGYSRSALARRLTARREYQRRASYLPGLCSAYSNVLQLTANTTLDLLVRKVERFFPRTPLPVLTRSDDPIGEVASLLRGSIAMLRKKAPLAVALTGGVDSRVTLAAAAGPDQDQPLCITYRFIGRQDEVDDVRFAQDLCTRFGLEHRLIEVDPRSLGPDFDAYAAIWHRNTGYVRTDDMAMLSYTYLTAFPAGRLHLKAVVSEVGRAFYRKRVRDPGPMSRTAMTDLYALSGDDPEVDSVFQRFIDTTEFERACSFNYDWTDLFYWEHRMSLWQGTAMMDHETSHETITLFNHRRLLSMLLMLSLESRLEDKAHKRLIEIMWPELAALPFNRAYGMSRRGLSQARRILRPLRNLLRSRSRGR